MLAAKADMLWGVAYEDAVQKKAEFFEWGERTHGTRVCCDASRDYPCLHGGNQHIVFAFVAFISLSLLTTLQPSLRRAKPPSIAIKPDLWLTTLFFSWNQISPRATYFTRHLWPPLPTLPLNVSTFWVSTSVYPNLDFHFSTFLFFLTKYLHSKFKRIRLGI